MKTLTVTFHHTTNYGAVLQTYALQHTIQSLGHENVVLETQPSAIKKKKNKGGVMDIIHSLYLNFLSKVRQKETTELKRHFERFHTEHLYLTKPYKDMEELRADESLNDIDCLIVGSDQVWNMATTPKFIDSRLLLFGPEKCKRISYAASIEELNYTDEQKQRLTGALERFDAISIREQTAKEYVESFSGKQCKRIIDPVFLLEPNEWNRIAKEPRIKGPYILCYQVQSNKRMEEVAYTLKKQTGYPVVSICNTSIRWIKSDYSLHNVSIEEFLGFYKNAAYVVSASFHGVAMGIVYGKPVYAMVKAARANRLRNIMEWMSLGKYVVNSSDNKAICSYSESDLKNASIRVCEERHRGLDFLKKNLG